MNNIRGVNVRSMDLRPHTLCELNEHGKLLMKCETTVLYLLKGAVRVWLYPYRKVAYQAKEAATPFNNNYL